MPNKNNTRNKRKSHLKFDLKEKEVADKNDVQMNVLWLD